jgi:hypothetical protein
MRSDVKTALVAPIIGFLIVGIYYLMVGVNRLNSEYGFFSDTGSLAIPILVCGVAMIIVAFISMFKLQMIEGLTFLMAGIAALYVGTATVADINDVFRLIVVVISALLVFMSYRVGDLRVMIFNILMVIAFIAAMNTLDYSSQGPVVGIILVIAGIVALAGAMSEWVFFQDVAIDCAEELSEFEEDEEK